MNHWFWALIVLGVLAGTPGWAVKQDVLIASSEKSLESPVASARASAAVHLGLILNSHRDDAEKSPALEAARVKLLDYYKVHRADLPADKRQFLSFIVYPDVAKALEKTTLANDFSVQNSSLAAFFQALAAAKKRSGNFDFAKVRIEPAHMPADKATIRTVSFEDRTNGAQILAIAVHEVGGFYDIDDAGVFVFGAPQKN